MINGVCAYIGFHKSTLFSFARLHTRHIACGFVLWVREVLGVLGKHCINVIVAVYTHWQCHDLVLYCIPRMIMIMKLS